MPVLILGVRMGLAPTILPEVTHYAAEIFPVTRAETMVTRQAMRTETAPARAFPGP